MANHGGYRRPSSPAPVSGPGALSRRTDGGPGHPQAMTVTGQSYGENQATNAAQSAAPLSPPRPAPAAAAPAQMPTPLTDPSANPGEPVTAGADAGAGPTSADIGLTQSRNAELRQKFGPLLPVFMRMADSPYATSEFKRQVRQLMAAINQ